MDHILDQKYLPEQYGGMNGDIDELTGKIKINSVLFNYNSHFNFSEYWKNKIESYQDWFLEDKNYRSSENLRYQKPTPTNVFSILRSFNPFNSFSV